VRAVCGNVSGLRGEGRWFERLRTAQRGKGGFGVTGAPSIVEGGFAASIAVNPPRTREPLRSAAIAVAARILARHAGLSISSMRPFATPRSPRGRRATRRRAGV
jgi:hypothetical protein